MYIIFFYLVIYLGDILKKLIKICLVWLHLNSTLWDVSWFIQTVHYCWTFGLSQSLATINSLVYVFFIIFWQWISKSFSKDTAMGKWIYIFYSYCKIPFQWRWSILHAHQPLMRAQVFSKPLQERCIVKLLNTGQNERWK